MQTKLNRIDLILSAASTEMMTGTSVVVHTSMMTKDFSSDPDKLAVFDTRSLFFSLLAKVFQLLKVTVFSSPAHPSW